MTTNDFLQVGLYLAVLLLLVKPVGSYMALVFADAPNRVTRFGSRVERGIYRLCGIRDDEAMGWKRYALAMLLFNVLGVLVVYLLQRLQQRLPLNPQHFAAVSPDSAMNTAISFASNTNWQAYSGESTMGYLTQMAGLGKVALMQEPVAAVMSTMFPYDDPDEGRIVRLPFDSIVAMEFQPEPGS